MSNGIKKSRVMKKKRTGKEEEDNYAQRKLNKWDKIVKRKLNKWDCNTVEREGKI